MKMKRNTGRDDNSGSEEEIEGKGKGSLIKLSS